MANELLEQDIQAIIQAGGTDSDVEKYLKDSGVSYSTEPATTQKTSKPLSRLEQIEQGNKEWRAKMDKNPFAKFMNKATDYISPQALSGKEYGPGEQNIFGDVANRPGAAIRGAIFPKPEESRIQGYMRGAGTPESQPSASESLYLKSGIQPTGNKALDVLKAYPSAFAGQAIDIATQPATWAGGIASKFLGKGAIKEVLKAGQITKATAEDILSSPLGQTVKQGITNVVESAKYPLKSGKTLGQAFGNIKNPAGLAERSQKAFYKVKSDLVSKFGDDLDKAALNNPDKSVSLRNNIDYIKLNMEDMPSEVQSVFRKTPILNSMLDNPELANNVNLRDTQQILNYLNNKVPPQIKFKHLDLLDTINDIRASQLDAFPEMANIRAIYAQSIEPYKNLRNFFKFNRTLKAIENDFGGPQGIKALKSIMPKEMIKEIGGYKNAIKLLRGFGIIGKVAIGGGVAGAAGKTAWDMFGK